MSLRTCACKKIITQNNKKLKHFLQKNNEKYSTIIFNIEKNTPKNRLKNLFHFHIFSLTLFTALAKENEVLLATPTSSGSSVDDGTICEGVWTSGVCSSTICFCI